MEEAGARCRIAAITAMTIGCSAEILDWCGRQALTSSRHQSLAVSSADLVFVAHCVPHSQTVKPSYAYLDRTLSTHGVLMVNGRGDGPRDRTTGSYLMEKAREKPLLTALYPPSIIWYKYYTSCSLWDIISCGTDGFVAHDPTQLGPHDTAEQHASSSICALLEQRDQFA